MDLDGCLTPKKTTVQAFPAGRRGVNVSGENEDCPLIFQRSRLWRCGPCLMFRPRYAVELAET